MRRLITISFFVFISTLGLSQQDPLFNQYLFNPFYLNPAYCGNSESISGVLFHRSQWVGFTGSPQTQTLSVNGPVSGKNIGLGVQLVNDKIGSRNSTGLMGSYAYKLKFDQNKLSFGIRAGLFQHFIDKDELSVMDDDDLFLLNYYENKLTPSFDFGAYYTAKRYFVGFTTSHLNEEKINFSQSYSYLKRHYVLTGGYAINASENLIIKPSTLIRYTANAPINYDVNVNFDFKEVLNLGVSYRSSRGIVGMFDYNITKKLWVGYSFDLMLNDLGSQFKGTSHEIYLGYDLVIFKEKTLNPRFL